MTSRAWSAALRPSVLNKSVQTQGASLPNNKACPQSTAAEVKQTGGSTGSLSARLEKELERTLREFVRMRTVSADPSLREDCFRGAKYLASLLESLGAPEALVHCAWIARLSTEPLCT